MASRCIRGKPGFQEPSPGEKHRAAKGNVSARPLTARDDSKRGLGLVPTGGLWTQRRGFDSPRLHLEDRDG